MSLVTGIDIIEIERIRRVIQRHGEAFLRRIYTATELTEADGNASSLAARFAAKEAVSKALGCGIGPVSWQEIEICRGPANRPLLRLYGAAASLSASLGLNEWSLSLSHSQEYAVAVAVALGGGENRPG